MLIQTREAIEKLKQAGFERREFSVRAERNIFTHNGRRHVEYGLAQINFNVGLERRLVLVNAMLKVGLSVTKFVRVDGSCYHIAVTNDGRGRLEVLDQH